MKQKVSLTDSASLFDEARLDEPKNDTVSSLTKKISSVLSSAFAEVTVEGEISNFLHHRSGHRYWTLKDADAQISCVFWKTRSLTFDMKEGQQILCRGRVTIYPPQGKYQLDVLSVRPLGIGALQQAYERLFKKLEAEGLFDMTRKRPIPQFPRRIGIVTSANGAALHDILTVLRRRYPLTEVLLRPSAVQGLGAELHIAQAIRDLNLMPESHRPDVLIVGRGGGSLEDLWCFNEEAVVRAIFASNIPVISAVGHEVDVTIADFVADLRAPTPTAAAELATPDIREIFNSIDSARENMIQSVRSRMRYLEDEVTGHLTGYGLRRSIHSALESLGDTLDRDRKHLIRSVTDRTERLHLRLDKLRSLVNALDPKEALKRGYALVRTNDGSYITKAKDFTANEADIVFSDGSVRIKRIERA
jgi:exodeoxyribonuclease VII large subunit